MRSRSCLEPRHKGCKAAELSILGRLKVTGGARLELEFGSVLCLFELRYKFLRSTKVSYINGARSVSVMFNNFLATI